MRAAACCSCSTAKRRRVAAALIDGLKAAGDTAGCVAEVRVHGLKSGFGSCMTYEGKLDGRLAGAVMGVQAVKGVEIGLGFAAADLPGSRVHDEIFNENGAFVRHTNNAGGIEGGMSNGEDIVLRAAMKPIPTLMRGLNTVDCLTGESCKAAGERSDVAAGVRVRNNSGERRGVRYGAGRGRAAGRRQHGAGCGAV